MLVLRCLSFVPGAHAERGPAGESYLITQSGRLKLQQASSHLTDALLSLNGSGTSEIKISNAVLLASGVEGLARWYHQVTIFARRGLLQVSVTVDGELVATLEPIGEYFTFEPETEIREGTYLLSRFAYLRREEAGFVLESPRASARLVFHHSSALSFLDLLRRPLATKTTTLNALDRTLLSLCLQSQMAEDSDPSAVTWDFHDLLFHGRSRAGRHAYPSGGTCPHPNLMPAALKDTGHFPSPPFALYRPDIKKLAATDASFTQVQEARRSFREYSETPMNASQLGEFLFRVARVKAEAKGTLETPNGPLAIEVATRPYPMGGALYEIEFYIVTNRCEGVPSGLHYYEPAKHQLHCLKPLDADVQALLLDSGGSAAMDPKDIQVLVILATRHQRIAWKYASIAYALTLKHVGVIFQTMYLAATAMGLAPCALGSGNSGLFAKATGLDECAETSVGEFLLGSHPDATSRMS